MMQGMVCAEGVVNGGRMPLTAVTFDGVGSAEPVLVAGSRHRLAVRDEMKALVDESNKVYSKLK